jgi:hypothetical protein
VAGLSPAKEAEFVAAVAEFDDDFAFIPALEKGRSADVKKLLAKGISPNLEIRPSVFHVANAAQPIGAASAKNGSINAISRLTDEPWKCSSRWPRKTA